MGTRAIRSWQFLSMITRDLGNRGALCDGLRKRAYADQSPSQATPLTNRASGIFLLPHTLATGLLVAIFDGHLYPCIQALHPVANRCIPPVELLFSSGLLGANDSCATFLGWSSCWPHRSGVWHCYATILLCTLMTSRSQGALSRSCVWSQHKILL